MQATAHSVPASEPNLDTLRVQSWFSLRASQARSPSAQRNIMNQSWTTQVSMLAHSVALYRWRSNMGGLKTVPALDKEGPKLVQALGLWGPHGWTSWGGMGDLM